MTRFARVRFASPLPALDREFDYGIPDELGELVFGQLIEVPFGKGKSYKQGIVVAILDEAAVEKTELVSRVISKHPLLTQNQYQLFGELAKRFCGSVGEILSQALPKYMKRADEVYSKSGQQEQLGITTQVREYVQSKIDFSSTPDWVNLILATATSALEQGFSTIICLPDYRDYEVFEVALRDQYPEAKAIGLSSELSNTHLYNAYLDCLYGPRIIYGMRSAVLSPAFNLGAVIVKDDLDDSHIEQTAPYWNSRDVALVRQQLEQCSLYFVSTSPSTEVVRLIDLGFLKHNQSGNSSRMVRIVEHGERFDDETYALISKLVKENKPVLVQISTLGTYSALACRKCSQIRTCSCGAGIWTDAKGAFRCRSCKEFGELPPCTCGSREVRPVGTGSQFVYESLSRTFGSANVILSTGNERIKSIENRGVIVVATPGAEPDVIEGYKGVVFADASRMLGAPRLRALETSCLKWANAISKSANDAVIVYVGLNGEVASKLRSSDFFGIVREDMIERQSIGLPPSRRLGSVSSRSLGDLDQLKQALTEQNGQLTLLDTAEPNTLVFSYGISKGEVVAELLRTLTNQMSSKSKSRLPGERLFRVKMDDLNAI